MIEIKNISNRMITNREIFDEDEKTQKAKGYGNIPKGSIVEVLDKYHNMFGQYINVRYHGIVYATKEEYLSPISDDSIGSKVIVIPENQRVSLIDNSKERFAINILNAARQEIVDIDTFKHANPISVVNECKNIIDRYITNIENSIKGNKNG